MDNMNLIKKLPPMLSGSELEQALTILPAYDPAIVNGNEAMRLIALTDIYKVFVPNQMSREIYSKLYLALLRSLQKKEGKLRVKQGIANHQAIMQQEHSGILGGSDSFTIIGASGIGKSSSIPTCKSLNYHPDVNYLLDLVIQTYLRPYVCNGKAGLSRIILRKEITPYVTENIAAFYNNLVNLYYIDCVYKAMEQYRDEYYYNFSWFYDIEKQDSITAPPVLVEVQQVAQTDDDNAYVELNAQYERERKRVAQICQKHAHELAEKDRAIAERTGEIEKLQKQIQLQQEYFNLVNAAEEPDVTEALDISRLYGKRFLFVGKLHESNAKLKQTFPTSTFMETDTANIKSLKVDGVVFLIRNMGHSMYYKVMQNSQFAELPKIYCNSRNINNIYQSMLNGVEM